MAPPRQPEPKLNRAGHQRALSAAAELADRLGIADRLEARKENLWDPSAANLPTLQLDDVSGIPFLSDIAGVEEYQHRGRLRAGTGDLYVTVTPAAAGYEDYCRDQLNLGSPESLVADGSSAPLAVAEACGRGDTFDQLVDHAKKSGGLVIHPYMGIEPVWNLAQKLSEAASGTIKVLAPPPEVTWIANDKMLLSELVTKTVGEENVVETIVTHTASELATRLKELAERHQKVALKRLRTASAMGNTVFDGATVKTTAPEEFENLITMELSRMQWDEIEPILAVSWEETDCSPSTQWWIPSRGEGLPRLDGIYEQLLEGESKVFLGSKPSSLPWLVEEALVAQSYPVVIALQELGYVGRCSFDHLVLGDLDGEFSLKVTECNGRWGGTSTPMSLVDRLIPGSRPPYRAQDYVDDRLVGTTFPELCGQLGETLFDAKTGLGSLILYNVGPLERDGKFDVITLGSTQEEAEEVLLSKLPQLLGLVGP